MRNDLKNDFSKDLRKDPKTETPQPNEERLAELGPVKFVIRPPWTNLAAGGILTLLLVGAMIAGIVWIGREAYQAGWDMPWYEEKEMCWFVVVTGLLLIAALGVAVGALLLCTKAAYEKWSYGRIYVCENGLYSIHRKKVLSVLYDEVVGVIETVVTKEHPPILYPPFNLIFPPMIFRSYTLVKFDGRNSAKFQFDKNSGSWWKIRRLAKILEKEMRRRYVEWEVIE